MSNNEQQELNGLGKIVVTVISIIIGLCAYFFVDDLISGIFNSEGSTENQIEIVAEELETRRYYTEKMVIYTRFCM